MGLVVKRPIIKELSIPGCIMPMDKCIMMSHLHQFCYASEYGYGVDSYLLTTFEGQTVSVHLMMANFRLALLKSSIFPCLEMSRALESLRPDSLLQEELEMPLEESGYWTDSIKSEEAHTSRLLSHYSSWQCLPRLCQFLCNSHIRWDHR